MSGTSATIIVSDEQDLINAIQAIDTGTVTDASGQQTNNVTIRFAQDITLNQTFASDGPLDLPVLDNPDASVTIDGSGFTLNGEGEVSGLRVLDGSVTLQNLTMYETVAQGGAGGDGLAGGGGGAGLGGGLFVGSDASVTLSDVSFIGDAAVGGSGGQFDSNDDEGGGGGGLGGAGDPGGDSGLGGGGGGGIGQQTVYGLEGTAAGEASGGGGGGQAQNEQSGINIVGFFAPIGGQSTQTSGGIIGGGDGGEGGSGGAALAGGGGGGIGGQTAQNFNNGSVQPEEIFPGANLISTVEAIALGAIDPAVAVAEGLAQTAAAIYNADETGDWSPVAIAGIATDAVLAGVSAYGAYLKYATTEYQSLTDILKTEGEDAFEAALFTKLAVKGAIMAPDYILEQVLQEHTAYQTDLLGAYDPISQGETGPLANLSGQSSNVTTISSTGFETDEPTAGGAGGWGGGGGGGGGVGGAGGFGGGGGGGGTPSQDQDYVGGDGGFGGGGGGGGLNAEGGTGGFGAGNGTDGAYRNPVTGQVETYPGVGGGGLGAGGGIFVESGGQLTFASTGGVQFANDFAQGGVGIDPGMGLGNDLFVQGAATLNFGQQGTVDLAGGISDENGAEAGYEDDQVGLDIGANSGVELGNVNLFTGFTTVGDASAGAQNEAVEDGPQGSDPGSAGFTPNGFLEMLPGSTFSNQLVIQAYAGATIQMDAGSTFTGSIYLGNLNSGDPLNLIYTPNANATTAAEVLPWSVDVFPGGTGGSIDMVGVQSDGTRYDSVLNVNGTLRIVRFSPDGWNGDGTELTLLAPGGDFYNVDSLAGVAEIDWALGEEGAAAPADSTIIVGSDNADGTLELAPGTTLAPIAGQSVYISATLTDSQTAAGSLIIDGDPTALVDFQAPSDFSGGVTLQSGTLEFDDSAGAGSGPVVADAGFGNVVALVVGSGFDSAVTITSGTLDVDQAYGWGTGTLTLAPDGSPVAVEIGQDALVQTGSTYSLAAPIEGFGNQAVIDLTGLAYNPDAGLDTVAAAGGTLTVSNGTVTDLLSVPDLPAGGLAAVADGQGGIEIFNAITVSNEAQWDAAITQVDGETAGGYAILFTADVSTSQDAPVISLASGVSLAIEGAGHTLDGGGQNRGLFVQAGMVTLNDLTIANARAQGGAAGTNGSGGGGGGGAGLGGGLFVASGAAVTLDDVNFAGDAAVGGTGGFGGDGEQPGNGGGYGLGNASGGNGGGGVPASFGGGGYGGFGTRGAGGFGGGAGGLNPEVGGNGEGGGGGLGAGGDIFLQQGGTLTILGGTLSGGSVTGGAAGNGATGGQALGSGIFLQADEEISFAPLSGVIETINDVIADQNGDGGTGGILLDGAGTLALEAANDFRGGVTLDSGTLELGNAQAAGAGAISFASVRTVLILDGTAMPENVLTGFAPTDTIELTDIAYDQSGTVSLNPAGDVLTVMENGQTYALNFDSSVAGQHFQLASYGNGAGTEIEVTGLLPTINGLGGTSYVNTGSTTDLPFAGVTIGDANLGGPIDTLTITFSDANAALNAGSVASGVALTSAVAGSYTLTGTAADITNTLDALTLTAPAITTSLAALDISLALVSSAGTGVATAASHIDIVGPGLGRTYGYSGQIESFTASVSGIYDITADGAQGGGSYRASGGLGAMAGGDIYLAAGTGLEIVTGGEGAPGTLTGSGTISSGGGGGGASFVIETATAAGQLAAPLLLLVAGGGGGAGQTSGGGGLSLGSGGRGLGFIYGAGGANGAPGFASENSFGGGGGGFTGGESGNFIESGENGAVAAQSFAGGAARLGGGSGGFGGGGAGGAASSGGGGGGYGGGGGGGTHGAGGGGGSYIAADAAGVALAAATHTGAGLVTITLETVECFARGTRILTPGGERAVEALRPGDLVTLHHGATAPIKWIGQRRVNCQRHPKPEQVWPVKILPGAFAPGRPHRDLLLSPDHAVFADGVLIPIKYLANGTSVAQVKLDEIEYFHVELDRHEVVYAEGLPCETYLDTGNRNAFWASGICTQLHPRFTPAERYETMWEAAGCAPLRVAGEAVERAAARLRGRAMELAETSATTTPAPVTVTAAFCKLLNLDWYLSAYDDVARAGADPAQHYENWGWQEGRLPCPEIDLIRGLGLVDPFTAMFTMPDVLAAGLDPVEHFCTFGWRERRRPNLYFDTAWYAETYRISDETNPLLHYLCHGERQGLRPSQRFDPAWYRQQYGIADRESPLAHYLQHRGAQLFSPLPSFDVDTYRARHAVTLLPGRDPYAHALAFGQGKAASVG